MSLYYKSSVESPNVTYSPKYIWVYVVHSFICSYTSHIIISSRRMWLNIPSNILLCTAYIRILQDIMESRSVMLVFWNGKARPSVSACDAVARDLEHFVFKVNIYVTIAKSYHIAAATCQISLKFELHTIYMIGKINM